MRYLRRTVRVAAVAAVLAALLVLLASEEARAQTAGVPAGGTVAPAEPFPVLPEDPQVLTVSFVDAAGAPAATDTGLIVTTTLGTLSNPSNATCSGNLCAVGVLLDGGTFAVTLNHGGEDGVATVGFVTGSVTVSIDVTLTQGIDATLAEGVASITLELVGSDGATSFEPQGIIADRDAKAETSDELLAVVRTLDAAGKAVLGGGLVSFLVVDGRGAPVGVLKKLSAQPGGDPAENSGDSNSATHTNACSGGVFASGSECRDHVQSNAGLGEPGALAVIDIDATAAGAFSHGAYTVVASYLQGSSLLTAGASFTVVGPAESVSVNVAVSLMVGEVRTVKATVRDAEGNPIGDGTRVTFIVGSEAVETLDVTTGEAASVAETSGGQAVLSVRGVAGGSATIVAIVGGKSGSATVGVSAAAFVVPPARGLTQGVAGANDFETLISAQAFTVESVWRFDIASQRWLSYVPGGPEIANSLKSIASSDIVLLKSR